MSEIAAVIFEGVGSAMSAVYMKPVTWAEVEYPENFV